MMGSNKMVLIAHRGNTSGPDPINENKPDYIIEAVSKYDVEVDVWRDNDSWWLGHDRPQYKVNEQYIMNDRFWCHAKNLEAFRALLDLNVRCFWHQEDDYTLTSTGVIWTYPLQDTTDKSVIVCQSLAQTLCYSEKNIYGICSDYIGELK
jgi:hypothetical protein